MEKMDKDPCWKGYEMIGTKKKNGKTVPNCVPKEEACCDDCAEPLEEEAEYEGRKVTLNKPFGGDSKHKRYVYVKNDKGNIIKLGFGDPNMEIKRDDPERRKAYRARHNCDNPGPKWKANYWSCKYWSATPTSKLDEKYSFKSYLEGVERDKVDLEISKEITRDKERHDRMRDAADRVDAASSKAQGRRLAQEGFASSVARVTLSTKDKARVMNVVSDLSDIPGNWDHKGMKFSAKGEAELKKALKNNKSEIAYAMSLDYSDFEESVSTVKESVSIPMYVQEAAYAGNIGMMELIKFYQKAKPDQVKELQNYIRKKMDKDAWQLVQKITGTKLVGKEFHKEEVAANSVAGGGVDMNPTGKAKWDKRSKFHIDHMFRRADGTKYKKEKKN